MIHTSSHGRPWASTGRFQFRSRTIFTRKQIEKFTKNVHLHLDLTILPFLNNIGSVLQCESQLGVQRVQRILGRRRIAPVYTELYFQLQYRLDAPRAKIHNCIRKKATACSIEFGTKADNNGVLHIHIITFLTLLTESALDETSLDATLH